MTLRELKPGQTARIVAVRGKGAFRRRILDMGITTGVGVGMVRAAPLGDPLEITLRGYQLSLRKDEAAAVEVEWN